MIFEKYPIFKNLTGHEPYPHQIATYEALARSESVILRAPTGSGKSEAVFISFCENYIIWHLVDSLDNCKERG